MLLSSNNFRPVKGYGIVGKLLTLSKGHSIGKFEFLLVLIAQKPATVTNSSRSKNRDWIDGVNDRRNKR